MKAGRTKAQLGRN